VGKAVAVGTGWIPWCLEDVADIPATVAHDAQAQQPSRQLTPKRCPFLGRKPSIRVGNPGRSELGEARSEVVQRRTKVQLGAAMRLRIETPVVN
jgi:hypothetical protein